MLSVSGMRGLVGQSITPPLAARYAAAFGSWLKEIRDEPHPRLVVARDSRPSGPTFEHAVVAGLNAVGCRVVVLGIVATPTAAVMVDHLQADGGMIITASHNPIIWNGIKAIDATGCAPPPDQARQIIDRFHADQLDYVGVDDLQPIDRNDDADEVHVRRVLDHLDVERIRRRGLKAVVDSVCGAGGDAARRMLEAIGVELVHLHAEPTGRFPHPPEPKREHLTGLCDAVRQHAADIGFAQDPDADRLAVVDDRGRYIGEEYTLALGAMHVLASEPGPAAANLSSSRMLDDVAASHGVPVIRTAVGEANVVTGMRRGHAVIGGEGNGGIIWPKVVYVRDSIGGMGLLLELLAARGEPLSRIVDAIPNYAIEKHKLPIEQGMADRAIATLRQRYADQKIDLQDGIRIDFDQAWVHVRPSNTEPILRLIAEAPDEEAARQLIADVQREIKRSPGA